MRVTDRIAALGAAVLASAAVATPASAQPPCPVPAAGEEWEAVAPERLGLDPARLAEALAYGDEGVRTVAVYRHGCLAGTYPGAAARDRTYESWSTAKTVVSLAAGRAMTLGLLSPDDRVGSLIPEADRAHGAITVRQLLEMTSGLHWNFVRDYTQTRTENRVHDALTLPFDHEPGTRFEYSQTTVALVAELVARAARRDFQDFVDRELFAPIGIPRDRWSWLREQHGHTLGYMGLQLRPADYARIGQLLLARGVWNGRRLVSDAYIRAATTPSRANPGYGWLLWVNAGERFVAPTIVGRDERARRVVDSAPPDMVAALGRGDQTIMVIPSLDMVITRSTEVGAVNGRGEQALASTAGLQHEFLRRVMRAVVDTPVPDAGPYEPKGPVEPYDPGFGLAASLREPEHVAAARRTPPLPPRGPRVARAVQLQGAAVHVDPIRIPVDAKGRARVRVSCPPAGTRACAGVVAIARDGTRLGRARYRAPRGRTATVAVPLERAAGGTVSIRATNAAEAGDTVVRAAALLVRGDARMARRAAGDCPPPPAAAEPDTDGVRDARAGDPLFRRVAVPGFTDVRKDTAGIAVQDFDGDRRADLFAVYNDGTMTMLLGRGCLRFERHGIEIVDSPYTAGDMPGGAGIANWADLNDDGFLDAFITRNRDGSNITQLGARPSEGNTLLLSRGRFDRFAEAGRRLGVANAEAYNRASSILDVDGDGWLDIAVGGEQIGTPEFGGAPIQRLYVWRPREQRYVDIGGTRRAPDFGGPLTCDPARDKASPGILLRDLDGDRRPELVQGYHNDMLTAKATGPCVTGERRFGLFAWRNVSRPGDPRLRPLSRRRAPLGGVGRMRWNPETGDYDVVSHGLGLPYVFAADAFNSGRLDLLAVGPTDPEWHVNSDMVAGAFFRNRGGLRFVDETDRRGLGSLNWPGTRWAEHYGAPLAGESVLQRLACSVSNRRPTCSRLSLGEHQAYPSSVAWGDVDNDGCLDFVLAERREDPGQLDLLRNTLYRNRCDGTFAPTTTEVSGLSTNSISLEIADLDGDGLLDLVAGAQPTNSYPLKEPALPDDRYLDKVFLNTGAGGARRNHWIELDLEGLPQRRLLGAQLTLTALGPGGERFLGRRDYVTSDAYKSGRWPRVHWGLGAQRRARVEVRLPGGRTLRRALPCIDRALVLDVRDGRVRGCRA